MVKPNIGKPLTIKPELAQPPAPKPAAPPKKPAQKPAPPPAKSAARKPAAINPRGAIAAQKAGSAAKSHARQLAKRKPR